MDKKVGSLGTPQISSSTVSSTETTSKAAAPQMPATPAEVPQSVPDLSDHGKAQRKTQKQMSGVMKQAAFREALGIKPDSSLKKTEARKEKPLDANAAAIQGPDKRPQIVRTADGKFNLIRPAPLLENLILRGGGAKGVGNPPALIEMEKQGKLDGLKHVVGTSAGALTALCLASGHSSKDFQKISDGTKMMDLLSTPKGFEKRYPTLEFGKLGKDGGTAVELADKNSAMKVANYLREQSRSPDFKEKLDRLVVSENKRSPGAGDQARLRLELLKTQNFSTDRSKQMITFNDLRLLHQIEPSKFRELTLTGWDDKNKTTTYFNAKDYPDMPIAIAGRISMAIPPAFASVKYDPKDGKGVRHFADGGIGSNMPSEVVTRTTPGDPKSELTGRQRENMLVKTGIMTFDQGGSMKSELAGAYKAMHGSDRQNDQIHGIGNRIANALTGIIAGNKEIGITQQKDQQKIAESASNCFVIAHGDLGTFSLNASPKQIAAAKEHATSLIREQLKQRENQAYAQEFGSMGEILKELSPQDKSALLKGAIPDPKNYAKGATDPNFQAEMDLYNMVLKERKNGA